MSRESEADRVARRRRKQKEAQEKMQRKAEARQEKLQKEVTIREMDEEIARVRQIFELPQFADLRFPYIKEILVYVNLPLFTRLLGWEPRFPHFKAAWLISKFEYSRQHESTGTASVYLLFNGKICVTWDNDEGVPMSFKRFTSDRYYEWHLPGILSGLRELRQKLEESLQRPNNGVSHNRG
jgi:hypothetical protein